MAHSSPSRRVIYRIIRKITWAVIACIAVGAVFEAIVWFMPVDSATFVEWDSYGNIIASSTSHDSAAASKLRRTINTGPSAIVPLDPFPGCSYSADQVPESMPYSYTFMWRGMSIETVKGYRYNCGQGNVDCGGIHWIEVWNVPHTD